MSVEILSDANSKALEKKNYTFNGEYNTFNLC